MMFASFGENSKIQCGDREGREAFLPSSVTGFCVCCKIFPSQPSRVVSRLCAEAPRGGREWWWGEELLQKTGAVLWPRVKALLSCFPQAPTQAGWEKGSSLPPSAPASLLPSTPASSPGQPHIWRAEMAPGHLHPLTHMVQPHPVELLVVSLKIPLPKTKSALQALFLMSWEKSSSSYISL